MSSATSAADSRAEAPDRVDVKPSSGVVIAAFAHGAGFKEHQQIANTDDGYCRDEFALQWGNTKKTHQGCGLGAVFEKTQKRESVPSNSVRWQRFKTHFAARQFPRVSSSVFLRVGFLGYGLVRTTVEERDKNVLLHRLRQRICNLQVSRQTRQRNVLHRPELLSGHGHNPSCRCQ